MIFAIKEGVISLLFFCPKFPIYSKKVTLFSFQIWNTQIIFVSLIIAKIKVII